MDSPQPAGVKRPDVRIVAIAVVILLAAVATGYVVNAAHRGGGASTAIREGSAGSAPAPTGDVRALTSTSPFYVFKSSALNHDFGRLTVAAQSDTSRRLMVGRMRCNTVAFAAGRGLCLQISSGGGTLASVDASVLDATLNVTGRLMLDGYPSRARVSPDGRLAAVTTFVSGDSYAKMGFSTRTSILDLTTSTKLFDVASLSVTTDGQSFQAADFNFWGVTFQADSRHFYATLGSGGQTYLIHGDVRTKEATVVTTGIECPSVSPDGTLVAFKKRIPGADVAWHLWIMDVATGREYPTAETRYVDDQATWLDANTVMYGLAASSGDESGTAPGPNQLPAIAAGASIDTNIWAVPADGGGTPRLIVPHAWSAQPVT